MSAHPRSLAALSLSLAACSAWPILAPWTAVAAGPPTDAQVPWGEQAQPVAGDLPAVDVRARCYLIDHPTMEPIVVQGRPVWIAFEVKNFGARPVVLQRAPFWVNHRVEVSVDQWGLPGKTMVAGGGARPTALGRARNARFDTSGREKRTPFVLAPGQRRVIHRFDLAKQIEMSAPGVYLPRVVYHDRIRFGSRHLSIWVLPRPRAADLTRLNARPLRRERVAPLRRRLRPLLIDLFWDPLRRRYRLVTLGHGPLYEPVRPADQRCKKATECTRLDYACCCPRRALAARVDRLAAIRRRRARLCARGSCPEVVCPKTPAGLEATCIEGWCVPLKRGRRADKDRSAGGTNRRD